ncbi:MAG: DUF1559 domain-containing protein [Phycisphaerales bacterium]|nr:DUF1559 domain-containing protein [Phycisphaerales bacterium]
MRGVAREAVRQGCSACLRGAAGEAVRRVRSACLRGVAEEAVRRVRSACLRGVAEEAVRRIRSACLRGVPRKHATRSATRGATQSTTRSATRGATRSVTRSATRGATPRATRSAAGFGAAGRAAFTLIELLVVVAVIVLLMSLLVPGLGRAREQARGAVCMSNLRQIGVGVYHYWTVHDGRLPYVESPMTNGIGGPPAGGQSVPGFGNPAWPDAETNPFDRRRWPRSLPNVLMPEHLGEAAGVFVCPSAVNGWPRSGARAYTYREAAANQPNGRRDALNRYNIEHFGFLDGRMLRQFRMTLTGDPIRDAMEEVFARAVAVRDMILREGGMIRGPHRGGVFVLDRGLEVRYRSAAETQSDLSPNGFDQGAGF